MIAYDNNILNINGKVIDFPIRIKQILQIKNFVLVTLGFSAELDCGYVNVWTEEIDKKWTELNLSFIEPTLYCFDSLGNQKWKFSLLGYVTIREIDNEIIETHPMIKDWVNNNRNKKNVFLVYHDELLIVDYNTGEIYYKMQTR